MMSQSYDQISYVSTPITPQTPVGDNEFDEEEQIMMQAAEQRQQERKQALYTFQ